MNLYFIACAALIIVALIARSLAGRMDARSGLPAGRLVYSDTGYAVGRLGELVRDQQGRKVERPLLSKRYGLVGRPDYLIETDDRIIPIEVKSAKLPASGQPYDSHVFQVAAYCLLVEETLNAPVPYGVIRYRDGEVRVDYSAELRDALLDVMDEMRAARGAADVHRSHDEPNRCARCSMRGVCDEAL
jgi:CRISPR-associated exonuclease Cas4